MTMFVYLQVLLKTLLMYWSCFFCLTWMKVHSKLKKKKLTVYYVYLRIVTFSAYPSMW